MTVNRHSVQHNFAKLCFKQALHLLGRLSRDASCLLSQAAGNGAVQKGIMCHRPQCGLSWHPEDIRHSAHWHFLFLGVSRRMISVLPLLITVSVGRFQHQSCQCEFLQFRRLVYTMGSSCSFSATGLRMPGGSDAGKVAFSTSPPSRSH